ncbi:MAG TPA: acylphosphatase [Chitinophagales bacterium]|nr:acylphosphatase [Chitinophagales bacterium]
MVKHYKITVSGKVQGVFFRANTKKVADKLGIKGFVRNEANGNVYIEAEADGPILDEFTQWCRKGPDAAVVSGLKQTEGEIKGFGNFLISR